jgi:hypothetical protein
MCLLSQAAQPPLPSSSPMRCLPDQKRRRLRAYGCRRPPSRGQDVQTATIRHWREVRQRPPISRATWLRRRSKGRSVRHAADMPNVPLASCFVPDGPARRRTAAVAQAATGRPAGLCGHQGRGSPEQLCAYLAGAPAAGASRQPALWRLVARSGRRPADRWRGAQGGPRGVAGRGCCVGDSLASAELNPGRRGDGCCHG